MGHKRIHNVHGARILTTFFACSIVIFITISPAGAGSAALSIHFIDVGEGEAMLLVAPNGTTALVDTGNLITGHTVVEYLRDHHITSLDYLIMTHPHPDHRGGSFFVLQAIDVKKTIDNGDDLTQYPDEVYRWYGELTKDDKRLSSVRQGNSFRIGELTCTVLWPPQPFPLEGANARSLVLMFRYNDFSLLTMGDAPATVEKELLHKGYDLNAQILKVGHHGHADASSPTFLRAVSPEVSIISINEHNIHGYPSEEVRDRLEQSGSKIYTTYQHGTIIIQVAADGTYEVTREK